MTEEEKQPCLGDNKIENPVVISDLDKVENVKENSCETQLLNEVNSEVINDGAVNEVIIDVSATVSEITLNESDDKNEVIDEMPSVEEVETNAVNNRLSDDDDTESAPKDVANDSSSEEETCEEKGWRKPKSRTVMPGGGAVAARSPHSHDAGDARDEEGMHNGKDKDGKKKSKNKEDVTRSVLIEGVLFRARYLGSTQLACEGQPTKATRMLQAEEAVSRIKSIFFSVLLTPRPDPRRLSDPVLAG